jgi:FtsP/CotA-like multicopper oxidase with cupredoxin domain
MAMGLISVIAAFPERPTAALAEVIIEGDPVEMALPLDSDLQRYRPFEPVTDGELTGEPQEVRLTIARLVCPSEGSPCTRCQDTASPTCKIRFLVNDRPYREANVRQLKLNTASEWTLSAIGLHPFHIHVNPFQHERAGPDGTIENVWRDTLLVGSTPQKIRSRYLKFTGRFVPHCHILDYEDQGMMEVVEIVL